MIILDTNVISELLRPSPQAKVVSWVAAQNSTEVYLTTIIEAELRYGVAILKKGKRRKVLEAAIESILQEDFQGRILGFDSLAAKAYAVIAAERRAVGRTISTPDCQIAAIGRARKAAIATRNVKDFAESGIFVINPWDDGSSPS